MCKKTGFFVLGESHFIHNHFVISVVVYCEINKPITYGFRYLFGEDVDGTAYGVFGVMHEGQKYSLPSSLQRVSVSTRISPFAQLSAVNHSFHL